MSLEPVHMVYAGINIPDNSKTTANTGDESSLESSTLSAYSTVNPLLVRPTHLGDVLLLSYGCSFLLTRQGPLPHTELQ